MTQKSLAIMAAGLGSRFGSLKQLHPVYENFAILDYSIYDAILAGFNRIIFIVRAEILSVFKERYSNFYPELITIRFVIQDLTTSTTRKKPWGTGHALLMLKSVINEPFALINADDFYGRVAFTLMHDNLFTDNSNQNYFIGYNLSNTLSKNGSVSRGQCYLDDSGYLSKIKERTGIKKTNKDTIGYLNSFGNVIELKPNTIVSMNFWGFNQSVFEVAERLFEEFKSHADNLIENEFYITYIVDNLIKNKITHFKMLSTSEKWFGITYKSDEAIVKNQLLKMLSQEIYPKKLW